MAKNYVKMLVAGVLVVVMSGCSLFGPRTQTISVSTAPSGAEVYINGMNVGKSPLQYQARRSDDLMLEIRKPGYVSEYRNVNKTVSTLGIVDLIGGSVILVPFVGLLSSAAWKFEPASFGFVLEPQTSSRGN